MDKAKLLFLTLRPKHWAKNLFVFFGPFFSLRMFELFNFAPLILGFFYWCLASSAIYVFNDIVDRKEDLLHPEKKKRPIASGLLDTGMASILCLSLFLISLLGSLRLNANFSICIMAYFFITTVYSLYLKHLFILDVMCIAFGFVLRVISGAVLINVGFSEWIIMCTLLLSLLLGFGKRQEEITSLEEGAVLHRKVLREYNEGFLQRVPYALAASTIVCYMLYTVSQEAMRKFGTKDLIYTTPFVIYGLFRYIYIAYEEKRGADPTQVLFQDAPTAINIFLWIAATGMIIYVKR